MTDWVRLWHDMPTDPKWRVIARKSGQPLACVVALFTLMMTTASAAVERGCVEGLSIEDAAAALDMDEDAVAAIFAAMEGRVVESGRLSGWDRRQPKREDSSTDRVKAFRERSATQVKRNETHVKHDATLDTDTDTDTELEKKDCSAAAPPLRVIEAEPTPADAEAELFAKGKSILGKSAGGLIAKVLKAKGGNVALARAAIETASTKNDPREYLGGIVNAREQETDLERKRARGLAW